MTKQISLNLKLIGVILIALSVFLILIFYSSLLELRQAGMLECQTAGGHADGAACPHENFIPLQSYLGFTVTAVLGIIGLFLFFTKRKLQSESNSSSDLSKIISSLDENEKKIVEMISASKNVIFQSDLVEKSRLSKVQISRILDKLEVKGLIERRRKGMTNLVILK